MLWRQTLREKKRTNIENQEGEKSALSFSSSGGGKRKHRTGGGGSCPWRMLKKEDAAREKDFV